MIKFLSSKKTLAITLFFIIFCILGLPYTKWGFSTDDWGNIYHCIIKTWSDMLTFFTEGNMERFCHPCNAPPAEQAFFCGLYRPVSFLYYYIQYFFWGSNPYGYYLVTVGFHALNTALLFLIFSSITTLGWSFFCSLLFGFHPSLYNWLGWTSAQTYYIELFVLLLIFFCLHWFLQTQKFRWYLTACFLFLINVFLKEQTLFFPLWLIPASYVYASYQKKKVNFLSTIKISSGFWLVSLINLSTRLYFFPLTSNTKTLTFEPTLSSFITRIISRFFDFVTYTVDLFGLTWLPNNSRPLKFSVIFLLISLALWLFYYNTKKLHVLFIILSIGMFSWPALLMHYQPRYIYMSLAFVMLLFVFLKQFYAGPSWIRLNTLVPVGAMLLLFQTQFLTKHLSSREKDLHLITQAFQQLAQSPEICNRALCFFSLPTRWFNGGSAQAIWMLHGNNDFPVYQFNVPLHPTDGSPSRNYINLEKKENQFICTSQDTNTVWFEDKARKTNKASISIDQKYLDEKPLFITWDYEKSTFRIIS